jgi:hypothetical protein
MSSPLHFVYYTSLVATHDIHHQEDIHRLIDSTLLLIIREYPVHNHNPRFCYVTHH